MTDQEIDKTFVKLLIMFVAVHTGYIIGHRDGEKYKQKEAVEARAAYWLVDEDGKPKFKWITE